MEIKNHRLVGASYRQAHSFGGEMGKPTLIVLHDTAGRLDKYSSVEWFESADCNTSAHFTVERDGTITQQVPCNHKAWHAGPSMFEGRPHCNNYAVGIEIVNPGKCDKGGRAWFHKPSEKGFSGLQYAKTAAHGEGWWMDYTPQQIEAVTALCQALVAAYPITAITTHWHISPGRKIDTNPLFPLGQVRSAVFEEAKVAVAASGRDDDPAADEYAPGVPETTADTSSSYWSRFSFAKINELADQGSRVAGWIRSAKRWLWGTTVTAGGAATLVDTERGTANVLVQMVRDHPFMAMAVFGAVVAVGVYLFIKYIEQGLVSAVRDGRYRPRGG